MGAAITFVAQRSHTWRSDYIRGLTTATDALTTSSRMAFLQELADLTLEPKSEAEIDALMTAAAPVPAPALPICHSHIE